MTRRSFLTAAFTQSGLLLFSAEVPLHWIALRLEGDLRETNWPGSEKAICLGSLLKPFLALAFLATHDHAPVIECQGAAAGCWRKQGHGRQDLVAALANSCNVYFTRLAASIDRAALDTVCLSYGLVTPARTWAPSRLIGLKDGWPQSPVAAANAFAELARDRRETRVRTVLAGMAECASVGTARAVNWPCFAKTGTARCAHFPGELVDGFVVAIYPRDQPRHLILARRHNTSGAQTASFVRPLADKLSLNRG